MFSASASKTTDTAPIMAAINYAVYRRAFQLAWQSQQTLAADLPDACEVEVEIRQVNSNAKIPTLDDVYAIRGLEAR